MKLTLTKYQTIHIKLTLTTKYNLLTGDGAIGKTMAANTLKKSLIQFSKLHRDYLGNTWRVISNVSELKDLSTEDVVLMDESTSKLLERILFHVDNPSHDDIRNALRNSTAKFLFISRGMHSLPIDYRSVYTLDKSTPVNRAVRLFPDYMDFNSDYTIVTEDKKLSQTLLNVRIHDTQNKLQWCRDNAPESIKDLPDDELLEIMESAWSNR